MFDVVVANGRYFGGGMKMCPEAEPDDGLFDVVTIGDVTKRDLVLTMPKIYRGTHLPHPKAEALRGRVVTVETDEPVPVELDGEQPGTTPARFEVLPGAMRLRVPAVPERRAAGRPQASVPSRRGSERPSLLLPASAPRPLLELGDALLELVDPAHLLAELVDAVAQVVHRLQSLRAAGQLGEPRHRLLAPLGEPGDHVAVDPLGASLRRSVSVFSVSACTSHITGRPTAKPRLVLLPPCRTDSGTPTTSACASPRRTRRASPITPPSSSGSRSRGSPTSPITRAATASIRAQGIEALTTGVRVDYRAAAVFDDVLTVHVRCVGLRGARFTLRVPDRARTASSMATAETLHATVDARRGCRRGFRRGSPRRSLRPSGVVDAERGRRRDGERRAGASTAGGSHSAPVFGLASASSAAPSCRRARGRARRRRTSARCCRTAACRSRRRRAACTLVCAGGAPNSSTTRLPFSSVGSSGLLDRHGACHRRAAPSCSRRAGGAAVP